MSRSRQILALGGGGFLVHMKPTPLDDFHLSLAREQPRVCFVPTASSDSAAIIDRFYAAFAERRCTPTHLPLFVRDGSDPGDLLLAQDILFVGGGNTVNMLAIWRAHGVDKIMREAYDQGIILAGVSAGALCWFAAGTTDSFGRHLAVLHDGLGLLPGSVCRGETDRPGIYHAALRAGLKPGLAIDDGAAAHFVEGELREIVAEIPEATGHLVTMDASGQVSEQRLPARYLE